jgi:hypothetical protein
MVPLIQSQLPVLPDVELPLLALEPEELELDELEVLEPVLEAPVPVPAELELLDLALEPSGLR